MELSLRKQRILAAVVERYVSSSEPVGSQALAEEVHLGVSSATIRNEFAELEEMHILTHPHTSAGRIPTDTGYRIYVDALLRPSLLDSTSRGLMHSRLQPNYSAIEEMLQSACELLAQLTGYPAVVSIPPVQRDSVKHVQLGNVDAHRMLVVIYTASGHVEHRLFDLPQSVPASRVNRAMRVLNEKLKGKSIAAIRRLKAEDFAEPGEPLDSFLAQALQFIQTLLGGQDDDKILVEGVVYILSQPEFAEVEKARTLMETFAAPMLMHQVVSAPLRAHRTTFLIGREHTVEEMRELSFVGIPYGMSDSLLGSLGVLGPTRMKYWDVLPAVEQLSERIGECLSAMSS